MLSALSKIASVKKAFLKRECKNEPQPYCTQPVHSEVEIPKIKLLGGSEMPQIGLGTWKSSQDEVKGAVIAALRTGYRHFDCASIYQNERQVGQGLREGMLELGLSRSDIWVTGKLWNTSHRPDLVRTACEQSIHDLGLDYLDLYLMHWPVDQIPLDGPKLAGDPAVEETPLWETYEAMNDLLNNDGIVKAIGVSNFSIKDICGLIQDTDLIPEVNQVEIHPYLTQPKLVEFCRSKGIATVAYSPLGTGAKPRQSQLPPLLEHDLVTSLSQKYNKTPAQVVLRWSVQKGNVIIPKSINSVRIVEDFTIWDFNLTDEDMADLDNLNSNIRFVQPSFHTFEEDKE